MVSYVDLGATLVGIIKTGNSAIVIDTGISSDHAKKIAKAAGCVVKTVLLTHLHADHAGGASFFAEQGADVYISKYEASFLYHHELNTALLYGGATPQIYRRPFFLSKSVNVQAFEPDVSLNIDGVEIRPISTAGHSIGHTSFLAGKTLFAGDALTSPNVMAKHKLIYNYCPRRALAALERIKDTDFTDVVICHKGEADKKTAVEYAELQKAHILSVYDDISEAVREKPADIEGITRFVCEKRGLLLSQDSYILALSNIKGYLADMEEKGELAARFVDGKIISERSMQ
ncbi:MAG: MBL fold metallo-hydrolase [Deferribacteraceae bacterium]|jgi:glyoxylase-like metal-dependent hydrolase (beta-lactamase superfamily II)|nr:MBL fold metallo-hydrolase [Deferribacteraceae bacterium]